MKELTEQEALQKLTTQCAQAEHCEGEVEEKLRKWGMDEAAQARIMAYLTEKKFVDDERFCRFFVNDKLKYNKWGRRKIEQALYQKHVNRNVYEPVLAEVPDEEYIAVLRPLIKSKWKSIKVASDYERSMKLIKFAMGRGFDYSVIKKCIDGADDLLEDD